MCGDVVKKIVKKKGDNVMYKRISMVGIITIAFTTAGLVWKGVGVEEESSKLLPKREHFAFASDIEYLDGSRLEGLGSGHGAMPAVDDDGNVYYVWKYATSRIRCARVDGSIETIAGDDRWPGNLKLVEGPAAYFHNRSMPPSAGNACRPGPLLTVYGTPLRGEEYGSIYFHWPDDSPYKIFRNKVKNGRWWFKRLGTPGKPKPPVNPGQKVKLDDVDLTGAKIRYGIVIWHGNVYSFDEPKGEMTCLHCLITNLKCLSFLAGLENLSVHQNIISVQMMVVYIFSISGNLILLERFLGCHQT